MALEQSFRRLAIRPLDLCKRCRRTFVTSAQQNQQRSATASIADILENNKNADAAQRGQTRAQTTTLPPTSNAPQSGPLASSDASTARASVSLKAAREAIREVSARRNQRDEVQTLGDLQRKFSRKELSEQFARRWKPGDVYAPHDLTGTEMSKWKRLRRKPRPRYDVMDQLGINPLHLYKNFSVMSEYVSEVGRIKNAGSTSLRPLNQRRMAKAVRRAVGIGLMPGVYRHPELLRIEMESRRP